MLRILATFLTVLTTCLAIGQAYHFRNYGSNEGLQQVQVMAMCQDKGGYIWIGTHGGGLSKFDGVEFEIFNEDNGLSNDNVEAIQVADNGDVWVATEKGVTIVLDHGFKYLTTDDGLASSQCWALLMDHEGNFWIGTNEGVNHYKNGVLKTYTIDDGLANNVVKSLYEDKDGNIWIGTDDGISIYHDGYFFSYHKESTGLSNNQINDIYQDIKGNMWFCTIGSGLLKYDGLTFKNYKIEDGLGTNLVRTIIDDQRGSLWFGTMGNGLSVLKYEDIDNPSGHFSTYYPSSDYKNVGIWTSLLDEEGNLWFGSYGAGVFKLLIKSYKNYRRNNGLTDSFIWSIYEDSKKNIWVGTNNGGLFVLTPNDHNNQEVLDFAGISVVDGLASNRIHCILELADGSMLIATNMGMERVKYNEKKKKLKILKHYSNQTKVLGTFFRKLVLDDDGTYWAGTHSGLTHFRLNNGYNNIQVIRTYDENSGLTHNAVYDILHSKEGIWVATGGGVNLITADTIVQYTTKDGLVHDDVRTIKEDVDGNMLFGTGGGLSVLNKVDKKFLNITSEHGMVANRIYFLHLDSSNQLWIGTSVGVEKFDYDQYRKHEIASFDYLSKETGMVEVEANTNAVLQDYDGNMWFGTIAGLLKYYPNYRHIRNAVPPKLHISSVNANNFKENLKTGAVLEHDQNNITVVFTGISTSSPEDVLYSYKLQQKGETNSWSQPTKSRKITFNGLPPASYKIQVKARNADGVWTNKPIEFSFIIKQAIWKSWWFIVALIATVGIFLRFLFVWREKRLTSMNQYLEDKVLFRTKQLIEEKDKLEDAKRHIEKKNDSIYKSINYAQRIQNAILPSVHQIHKKIPELFIMYKPKEALSGDFYYFHGKGTKAFLGVIDCTGHGIPGAIMSMLGYNGLNRAITLQGLEKPAEILNSLTKTVCDSLYDSYSDKGVKDGMDISLCCFDSATNELEFSGAMNPIYLIRAGKVQEIKGDPQPIGMYIEDRHNPFTNNGIKVQKGDCFYMFTDGYPDQFGGTDGKKFAYSQLKKLLLKINHHPMELQQVILEKEFDDWKADYEQLDDVCVIGWRH